MVRNRKSLTLTKNNYRRTPYLKVKEFIFQLKKKSTQPIGKRLTENTLLTGPENGLSSRTEKEELNNKRKI